jgi:hypothetical protein
MYIARIIDSKSKKPYLVIKESFRNAKGISTNRNVKNYGYITKENEHKIMEKAKIDLAKLKENIENQTNLIISFREQNSSSEYLKNLGYCVLDKIYETLNINSFITTYNLSRSDAFNINEILKLLTYSRIL